MREWEKYIKKVVPYVPGEQPKESNMIKLNTNENPYPPAPGVAKILNGMKVEEMKLYPDPTAYELVEKIGEFYHIDKDKVFVGVGSDDVLAMAFMTFFGSNLPILFSDISYSFYPVWANLYGIPYKTIPLDQSFNLDAKWFTMPNGGIIIANPNAPTSIYEPLSVIEEIIGNNLESIVILDEAYIDFAGPSAVELIDQYENLLVVQTFSKSRSMAGMRIGFAMGNPRLIKALNDVKYSFNSYTLNLPAILAGAAAMVDREYFDKCLVQVIETRSMSTKRMIELGFSVLPSGTNFLFVTHNNIPAKEIYEYLREQHIYVRYFQLPRIDNYLRITVGTNEEMETLFAVLQEYIKK